MKTERLVALCKGIAHRVRDLIPRSANRRLAEGGEHSEWLTGTIPSHVKLLHTLVRSASSAPHGGVVAGRFGGTLDKFSLEHKKKKFFGTKYTYEHKTLHDMKRIILQFLNTYNPDMRYRTPDEEKNFALQLGQALADYLNNQGFRRAVNREGRLKYLEWDGGRIFDDLNSDLLEHQRMMKYNISPGAFTNVKSDLILHEKYVIGNARNAIRFRIGNCEEVASVAFVMLLLGKRSRDTIISTGRREIPVELVYSKSPTGGDAHFFVVVDRANIGEAAINGTKGDWATDPQTVVCDPWISDIGVGGRLAGDDPELDNIRDWIFEADLCVRAAGVLGAGCPSLKPSDEPLFYLP